MSLGVIMLCHTAFDRAAQVARFWADSGSPVVIHVDRRVATEDFDAFCKSLSDLPDVSFSHRHKCEWGTFGLVAATLDASRQILGKYPDLRHVYLASGSCLPLRPHGELVEYLATKPQTDFIESVTTRDVPWITGGLAEERFTLRFPFAWRKQRRLFDGYVRLQRLLGVRRRIPKGIVPHLGSQWWCLTRRTLASIVEDPNRSQYDHYFKRVWIPDESYFQTLARLYSTRIESRSLTLSKFDVGGRPHTFYDDHLQLLRRSDCFVARKIWPKADRLYQMFLSSDPANPQQSEPNPGKIDRLFAQAVDRRIHGRPGLHMQSRFPAQHRENGKTGAPYSVLHGFSDLFEGFDGWLAKAVGSRVHGHLFAPDRVEFAQGAKVFNGGLCDSVCLRDYNPKAFLTNLIWNARGEHQCFQFSPRDGQECAEFFASDKNAQISVISGTWALSLFRTAENFASIRTKAAMLQKIESEYLEMLRKDDVKARVRIWTMAEFIENPMENLQTLIDEINPRALRRLAEAPRMVNQSGFPQFLQNLRNQGMQPTLMGEFPVSPNWIPERQTRSRPTLVQ